MDLHPQRRGCRTAAGDDFGSGIPAVLERIEDRPRAERDAFHDGTEDMVRFMGECQPGDRTARQGIGVGRAVALEMVLHNDAFRTRWQRGRLPVHLRKVEIAAEEPLEPVDDRTGRGLSALDDVTARIDNVRIGAPDTGRMEGCLGHAELKVRRAGDEAELARLRDAEADHADQGVRPTLDDLGAGREAERFGGSRCQVANHLAGCRHPRRPFCDEIAHAERLDHRGGPAPVPVGIVPAQARIVERGAALASELQCQEILVLADRGRPGVDVRLVPLDPQRFRDHPFSRNGTVAVAVEFQAGIAGRQHVAGFLRGANIHPHQGRTQRIAVRVKRHYRAAGRRIGHRLDRIARQVCRRKGRPCRLAQAIPPVGRVLLGPSTRRELCLVRFGMRSDAMARKVVDPHPEALGASVGCQHVTHTSSPELPFTTRQE